MNDKTTTTDIIKTLTAKGRDAMTQIGLGNVSFFDGGIVEGEGSWGGCLVDDLGHKSSGVLNRLLTLGLFDHTDADVQDETNAGGWWTLTALGADVANTLAQAPVEAEKKPAKPAAKKASKPAKAKADKPATDKPAAKFVAENRDYRATVTEVPEGRRINRNKAYTLAEAGQLLDMSPVTVHRWVTTGKVEATRTAPEDGGRTVIRIVGAELSRLLKDRAAKAKAKAAKS